MLTQQEIDESRYNPSIHAVSRARIVDKRGQVIPLVPNIFQLRMQAAYSWFISQRIPPRLIALKPRQVGGSTAAMHLGYWHARNFRARTVALADTNLKSQRLWGMALTLCEHDTTDWGTTWREANDEIRFSHGSVIVQRSAEAPRQTRGETLQSAILSEVAWWRPVGRLSGDETAISLLNALADHEDTLAIIDTTPHGRSGVTYEFWCESRWPWWDGGKDNLFRYWQRYDAASRSMPAAALANGWVRIFAAWWEFPEHALPVEKGEIEDLIATMDDREREGAEAWGWTWEQIKWRRWCIRNKCRGSVSRMDEEYPESPSRMWLATGGSVFDVAGLDRLDQMARLARPEVGTLAARGDEKTEPVSFSPQDGGWLMVWEHPCAGMRYLITVDPMRGEQDMQSGSGERDRHAVFVLRQSYKDGNTTYNTRVVARIRPPCQMDNGVLARLIALLSRWYGGATVVVEVNMGFSLLSRLRDDYNTPLYVREQFDRLTNTFTRALGWSTTQQTRQLAIDRLIDAVRDQTIDLECEHAVAEMSVFERGSDGVPRAPVGHHDDDVLALAIGLSCMEQSNEYRDSRREYRERDVWQED